MKRFRVVTVHDCGRASFLVMAANKAMAARLVMECESCPAWAIVAVIRDRGEA